MMSSIITQAIRAWILFDSRDDSLIQEIGRANNLRSRGLERIHEWMVSSQSAADQSFPQFTSADDPWTETDALTFYLYTFADETENQSEYWPIAAAMLIMAIAVDPPMTDVTAWHLDAAFFRVVKAILPYTSIEDCMETYLYCETVGRLYAGCADAIRVVRTAMEANIVAQIIKHRSIIGTPDATQQLRQKLERKIARDSGSSEYGEDWIALVNSLFSTTED